MDDFIKGILSEDNQTINTDFGSQVKNETIDKNIDLNSPIDHKEKVENFIKAVDHYIEVRDSKVSFSQTIGDLYLADSIINCKDENLAAILQYDHTVISENWNRLEEIKKTTIAKELVDTLDSELKVNTESKSAKDKYLEDFANQNQGVAKTKSGAMKI